jgi:hypothetical protein
MERQAENRAKIQDLCDPINTVYDSSTLFFYVTKAAIRNLVRRIDGSGVRRVQMESLSLDFSIEGIDGRTSDFSL